MVFFTCGHCGEAVKKPSVEKHKFKCKNQIFVTCMDCLKDFGDDYVKHTSCVSELQRYSGKDFVPKESSNSGQKKQESWLEIVRSILDSNDIKINPQVRGAFQKLQGYENVPRKKAKFENFVKNSLRIRQNEAEQVWNVLEKALEVFKAEREAKRVAATNQTTSTGSENNAVADSPKESDDKTQNNCNGDDVKKESKKRKADEPTEESPAQDDKPKKKKKKKNSDSPGEGCNDTTNGHAEQDEVRMNGQGDENSSNQTEITKKKKKKSKNESNDTATDVNANESTAIAAGKEGQGKKKKTKPEEPKVNGDSTTETTPLDFNWTEVMVKIVSKKSNGMNIEKLKEKVTKKYKAFHQMEELPNKFKKTFLKKVRRSNGLVIENELVKIKV